MGRVVQDGCDVRLDLATRAPFAADHLFAFMAARAVPGVEAWDGTAFHRSLDLPHGHGVAELRPAIGGHDGGCWSVEARLRLQDGRDLDLAVRRVRLLFDLDPDPVVIDSALAEDPILAPLVAATPGLRTAGSVDPFETAVRAVIGQQISVAGACTVAGRIVASAGRPLAIDGGPLTRVFPTPAALATIDPGLLPMPMSRKRTIIGLAERVVDGRVVLQADADRSTLATSLLDVAGIGPWTVGYILMRGLGDPDVFLPTDLGVKVGLAHLGLSADRSERWRPWRSYALHHLWTAAGFPPRTDPSDSPVRQVVSVDQP